MRALLAVALLMMCGMAGEQQAKSHQVDWSGCKAVQGKFSADVEAFNKKHAEEGLQISVDCLYSGPKSYVKKPEQHIWLTASETERLRSLREKSNVAWGELDGYEKFLIDVHHVHAPKIGDACYYFVGFVLDNDYITVDPNPFSPDCRIEQPQAAAKQEKAQPAKSCDCPTCCRWILDDESDWHFKPPPFDLPAKGFYITARSGIEEPITTPMFSCKDVAPDWKQRVLLDSADGKHHCYAFYLLEQKP